MQSNKENIRDTRTFGEIYRSLTIPDRQELFRQMHIANVCCTRQTMWNWANGKSRPAQRLVLTATAKVVGRFLGRTVSPVTLFPPTR